MKSLLLFPIIFPFTGCATDWKAVGTSVIGNVQSGAVLAAEAFAAYSATNAAFTNANVTTGKLDAVKVLAAAQAINNGLQTPGLKSAVIDFVSSANQTITDLKGSPTPKVITALSDQAVGTVSTIQALPEVTP